MHQGGLGLVRLLPGEGGEELGHTGHLAGAAGLPLRGPAPQLALDVAAVASEVGQPGGLEVDRVDAGEHLDEVVGEVPPLLCRQARGLVRLAEDHTVDLGHDVEGSARHLGVVTQGEDPRHRHVGVLQGREHAVLARHVVRARQQLPERRSAHDHRALLAAHAVGEVGQAAGDDLGAPGVAELGQLRRRPAREGLPGQPGGLLVGEPGGLLEWLPLDTAHARSSLAAMRAPARRAARLAIDILCTSVAPS